MSKPQSNFWFASWHTETTHEFIRCTPVFSSQSQYQRIDIVDTERFGRVLLLDGEVQTSSRYDACIHESLCQPALLAHPHPQTVLLVGGGGGGALREILKHPTVSTVHMIEIDEEVLEACKTYFPGRKEVLGDPRVAIFLEDGSRFVESAPPDTYDVIILDMDDPKGPASSIFTHRFCQSAKSALHPDGLLLTHCESPDSAGAIFYRIIATYRAVFEHVSPYRTWIPPYSDFWGRLIASRWADLKRFTEEEIAQRIEERKLELHWLTPELFVAMFRSLSKDILSAMEQDWPLIGDESVPYQML